MGIRAIFKASWPEAVAASALRDDVDIYPETRIIVRNVNIGSYELGDCCIVYGNDEYPVMVSSRFPPDAILLPAFLHVMEQRKRLMKEGIRTRLIRESGLIQCIYTKVSPSSVQSSVLQAQHVQSTPMTSGASMESPSPQT